MQQIITASRMNKCKTQDGMVCTLWKNFLLLIVRVRREVYLKEARSKSHRRLRAKIYIYIFEEEEVIASEELE